jgi:phenylpyruvate tautomerase PptA (4-oxalocrotonate tautomerase family)
VPVRGTWFRVLDENRSPVPPGEVGELDVGGVQVARGYLGRPDLDAAAFVTDPLGAGPGARLYRTDPTVWDLSSLDEQRQSELVAAVTGAVRTAFGCEEGAISIALEPVEKSAWDAKVYEPEIIGRGHLLRKAPDYGPAVRDGG